VSAEEAKRTRDISSRPRSVGFSGPQTGSRAARGMSCATVFTSDRISGQASASHRPRLEKPCRAIPFRSPARTRRRIRLWLQPARFLRSR
jgi:hypothetical protein